MNPITLSKQQLQALGISSSHIVFDNLPAGIDQPLHKDTVEAFLLLKKKAALAGINLCIASGFRSYERQLKIWNEKATGVRSVLDANEKPVDIRQLSEKELVFYILRWSALPGTSRHHWGSEIDVYDKAAMNESYTVQLTNSEASAGGVFARLHLWLDNLFTDNAAQGFRRPYVMDRGGVSPERWHLSYKPVASGYEKLVTESLIVNQIQQADIALKKTILGNIHEIYHRFVLVSPN